MSFIHYIFCTFSEKVPKLLQGKSGYFASIAMNWIYWY